jgi:CubicO group peptidase (beta-lactamase class C family)
MDEPLPPPPPGTPPVRRLELADLPPAVAERVRFDKAAPRRLRSDRMPAPVQDELRLLWDGIAADIYDEVAGVRRTKAFDSATVERALRRVADRLLQAERMVVFSAVHYPLKGERAGRHVAVGAVGGGSAAAAQELAMYGSFGTATAVAILSAVVGEVFEAYVAASGRTRQYQRAGRSPDPGVVVTDLAEAAGYGTSVGRRATPKLANDAAAWLSEQIIKRTAARFTRALVPLVGVAIGAGMSAFNVRRVTKMPLRPPAPDELIRLADDITNDPREYAAARQHFLELDEGEALPPLPEQPRDVAWPSATAGPIVDRRTDDWPTGDPPDGVDIEPLLDAVIDDTDRFGRTYAVVVVHQGRIVAERYHGTLEHRDRPAEAIGAETPLLSWSMAKSILHAAVGTLVRDDVLELDEPAAVPEWHAPDDPRASITLRHLLEMRDGLAFVEDYVEGHGSDVIDMIFGSGAADVAGYAVGRPLAHPPGEVFNYSSGTSNVVARIVGDAVGAERGPAGIPAYEAFLRREIFEPLAMRSATPRFDDAGTWIASSFVYATARDFARFGLFYLRDGVWDGRRILPEGWVDQARRARSVDRDGVLYGQHWWVIGDDCGSFRASGYQGQSIMCVPVHDLVVVRLGKTPIPLYPHLTRWRASMVDAFRG